MTVDATAAIKTGLHLPIGIGLLACGLATGGAAALLIVVALRKEERGPAAARPAAQDHTPIAA